MKQAVEPGHGTFVAPKGIGAFNPAQKAPPIEPTTGVRKKVPEAPPPKPEPEAVIDMRDPVLVKEIEDAVAAVGGALTVENVRGLIRVECEQLAEMLVAKNRSYGNSALEPIQIFCKASPVMQIQARIDDKLNRIKKGTLEMNEDTVKDLLGYLVLLRVAQRLGLT